MGTAVRPAKMSPASWDAFADVDTFVDEVLTELAALALTAEGTRPTRSGPKPPLAGAALAQGDHGDLVRWLLRPAVARHLVWCTDAAVAWMNDIG
jgi:hypothetical protein